MYLSHPRNQVFFRLIHIERMKDYKISSQDFIANMGYSSHYFFKHSLHFLKYIQHNASIKRNIKIDFYRTKIILEYKNRKLNIKCHYKNKSRHYISILESKKEIAALHDSVPPKIMTNFIISLLLQ